MLDHLRETVQQARLNGEIRCWAGLGIAALGIAGIFALMLAVSRIPGIESTISWPLDFFEKGLVIHVIMSFVVWFLAVFATLVVALSTTEPSGASKAGTLALVLAVTGFVLLAVPAFLDRGEASLNNYIPVIIDPLYHTGLICFSVALLIVVVRFWIGLLVHSGNPSSLTSSSLICCLILVLALTCVGIAYFSLANQQPSERFFEDLFWGGGHVLQYLNTALMIFGWYILGSLRGGEEPVSPATLRFAMLLCLYPAIGAPFLYFIYGINSGALTTTFTNMQYLMAPPVAVMGFIMARFIARCRAQGTAVFQDLGLVCIMLSLMTFAIGGCLGLFVDGADTRTPAHYHAVIAAVNLVFMGLFFQLFLPVMGRPIAPGRAIFVLVWLYAIGQMIASVGLFLAGGYGAPRKTAGEAQGLQDLGAIAGLYMNGLGAAIAVIGGIMFIWICARALLQRWQ